MGKLSELKGFLTKQIATRQEFKAKDWDDMEDERRSKLEELQKELGFPLDVKADKQSGYPEVKENAHLPWSVNESGGNK